MKTNFRAIATVYSYYPPEIRKIVDDLVRNYPHDVFLKSVNPGLDDFHQPIINKLVDFYKMDAPDLFSFPFRYPTSGSEEFIREFLTELGQKGVTEIYVLQGDYEGYKAVAQSRGIRTIEVESNYTLLKKIKPGYWFISNPSARNGLIISNGDIKILSDWGHKIFYDLSYLGSTEEHKFDLSHPNIIAAAISFSKPYGLFYYRVGFAFSRLEIPPLYANKWFKNIFSLLLAEKILDNLDRKKFIEKYLDIQNQILRKIHQESGLKLEASASFLLANLFDDKNLKLKDEQLKILEQFRRHDYFRFCLTPYFLEHERENT